MTEATRNTDAVRLSWKDATTETMQSLQAFDIERDLKLTCTQARHIAEWHEALLRDSAAKPIATLSVGVQQAASTIDAALGRGGRVTYAELHETAEQLSQLAERLRTVQLTIG